VVIDPILVFGIPVDFILFALTLLGVALARRRPRARQARLLPAAPEDDAPA
jgi:hypothetical protein